MSTRPIAVEFAVPADAAILAGMSRDLIETGLGWHYRRERMEALFRDPDVVALVAREGGQAAGFAIMRFGEARAHLMLMAVTASQRRRGVGGRLLDWLAESAMTAGVGTLHLELRASNAAAKAFYRARGFAETLRIPGYYGGRETAIRMIRILRARGLTPQPWRPPTLDPR